MPTVTNLSAVADIGRSELVTMTANKKQLNLPKMVAVERIINIPIVESGWKYAGNIYYKIKNSNNLFTWTLDRAEDSIYNVLDTASPAVFLMEKPLNAIDKVLCRSLDIVEQRVPSITLPPQVIYHNTKEYVVRPVLKRADSVKEFGNSVLASKYTVYAADKLDGALDLADKYVDKYLPDDSHVNDATDDVDHKDTSEPPNKTIQTIQHMDRFSRKLQRRLTKLTLAEAKALKEHSVEAIHVLAFVAELVVTDPKLAFQKGKELWASLSQDEPENQARPENLEQLFVLLTRESARRVVHLVNFTADAVGKLPRSVTKYLKESTDSYVQMVRSIIKDHLAAILAEIQQSSQQDQQQKQQTQDQHQQTKRQGPIPQTTITKPSNHTYPLNQQETLQPPPSPKAQLKASHRHIVNGVENSVENTSS
ncbi:Perilipin family [Popillia japonica]|uniref:Perilipin family n=1 Tax=Popillia japonica TaxID=7064 RepID=A0AAW1L4M6_POPJA